MFLPQAILKNTNGDPSFSRKLRDTQKFTFKLKFDVPSAVIVLLISVCPNTISWLISAIVVHSFQSPMEASRRTWSHVRKELLKRFIPTFAHLYSSLRVVLEVFFYSSTASRLRRYPSTVLFPVFLGSRFPVRRNCISGCFRLPAATALRMTVGQTFGTNQGTVPAIAQTYPSYNFASVHSSFQNKQSSEPFTGQINQWWHTDLITVIRWIVQQW